jgi:hypothetical protein
MLTTMLVVAEVGGRARGADVNPDRGDHVVHVEPLEG